MEILAEGRALRQLGVPMPDSVVSILNQERRIKQFHQLLQQTLRELYSALEKIDPRLTTLFQPLVEMVTRCVWRVHVHLLDCMYIMSNDILYSQAVPAWVDHINVEYAQY